MKSISLITLLVLSCSLCGAADLPRSSPEAQGVASSEIQSFVEAVDRDIDSLNSLMIVRHGQVIAEGWWAPYHAEAPHSLYSLSKSFTSTAVGLAIAEGKLQLDDQVMKFFPDDLPAEVSDNLKAMRVSDLLRMNTGHQTEPSRKPEEVWTKAFLAHPVPFKPGTHFLYNTSATYMQSAIVQKVTGETVLDYLKPRLFEPLGIEHPNWEVSPQGVSTGGYGLSIRTGDIARFGQLYLHKGMWQGKQLVPAAWVDAATSLQTSNGSNPASDWDQGYGYQFWRCRNGAYRGDGAFGQYCIVLPEQDAVIAITSGVRDMQSVMNLVWNNLLPAMKTGPLAANDEAQASLTRTLKGLSLRPQEGDGSRKNMSGKKYIFPPNEQKLEAITIERNGNIDPIDIGPGFTINEDDVGGGAPIKLVVRFNGVERRIVCGRGKWKIGKAGWGSLPEQPMAASAAWTDGETLITKICFYETPFVITSTLKFNGAEVHYTSKSNVGFGPKSEVQLLGIAAEFSVENFKPPLAAITPEAAPATNPVANHVADYHLPRKHDFSKWEKEVSAYEAADKETPPPKGGILFVGSSTIRLWKSLASDFPDHKVINRGIGGSEIVDATHFADRIIFPYAPKQIYLRAGGNDIHAGVLPDEVAHDFADFVTKVHEKLPKTEIFYMAVNPAPSRWGEKDKNRSVNDMIRGRAVHMTRVGFVDCYEMTLNSDGSARKELFVKDMLHFNAEGYKLLAEKVRPFVPTSN